MIFTIYFGSYCFALKQKGSIFASKNKSHIFINKMFSIGCISNAFGIDLETLPWALMFEPALFTCVVFRK